MSHDTPEIGDVVAGKYRVDDVLGRGGMGIVFSATNQISHKRVALKWMLPGLVGREGAVERFVREAKNAGSIDDPHVVNVFDVGQDGSTFFLVMELLRGEPLSQLMKRPEVHLFEVLEVLVGATRGVAAAHAKNIIHRDLKPDNVFVCEYPGTPRSAKVLDFGISKLLASGATPLTGGLTGDGTALGTPYYMPPEQARGQRDIDHRADIYAFGVILFQVATGRVPFDADTYNALLVKILNERPPRPRSLRPELPEALEEVILRAMAHRREERYQSMTELGEALKVVVEQRAVGHTVSQTWQPEATALARPTTGAGVVTPRVTTPSRARRWVTLVLVALSALAGLAALGLGLGREFSGSSPKVSELPPSESVAFSAGASARAPAAPDVALEQRHLSGVSAPPSAASSSLAMPAAPPPAPATESVRGETPASVSGGRPKTDGRVRTAPRLDPRQPASKQPPAKHPAPKPRSGSVSAEEF